MVKPVLEAISSLTEDAPTTLISLLNELSVITSNLEADSILVQRYLLPEAARLMMLSESRSLSGNLKAAIDSYINCLSNLIGVNVLHQASKQDIMAKPQLDKFFQSPHKL